MFLYSFLQFPFCLPDVMGVTVVTFYVIDHSSLISCGDFVFGVDKMASNSIEGFQVNLDPGFPNYSCNIVRHVAHIREGDTALDYSVSLRGRGSAALFGSGGSDPR